MINETSAIVEGLQFFGISLNCLRRALNRNRTYLGQHYPRLAGRNLFHRFPVSYTSRVTSNPDERIERAAVRPENDPLAPERANPRRSVAIIAVVAGMLGGAVFMGTGNAQAAWQEIADLLSLHGKPVPASANVLSEHEVEGLDQMTPQSQAQLLLERSINHYRGANDQIAERVGRWRGKIELDQQLRSLFMTALNSDDLRVRAAAIEVDVAGKPPGIVDRVGAQSVDVMDRERAAADRVEIEKILHGDLDYMAEALASIWKILADLDQSPPPADVLTVRLEGVTYGIDKLTNDIATMRKMVTALGWERRRKYESWLNLLERLGEFRDINNFAVDAALDIVKAIGNHFEMLRPDTAKYFEGFWRRSGKAWDLAYAIEMEAGVANKYSEADAHAAENPSAST